MPTSLASDDTQSSQSLRQPKSTPRGQCRGRSSHHQHAAHIDLWILASTCGFFEAGTAHLHEVVLHDVPDDAELVKVAPAALRAEGLLEADLDVGDRVAAPGGRQELVGKPVAR